MTGQGKLEKLAVAAQEIAASTAQLVVASRVKADKNSTNLQQVSTASKTVTNATAEVVATVKDCSSMIDEAGKLISLFILNEISIFKDIVHYLRKMSKQYIFVFQMNLTLQN